MSRQCNPAGSLVRWMLRPSTSRFWSIESTLGSSLVSEDDVVCDISQKSVDVECCPDAWQLDVDPAFVVMRHNRA